MSQAQLEPSGNVSVSGVTVVAWRCDRLWDESARLVGLTGTHNLTSAISPNAGISPLLSISDPTHTAYARSNSDLRAYPPSAMLAY